MNERIKQLAEQAGIGPWGITIDKSTEIFQKFAELIVRDCASICELNGQSYTHSFTPAKARLAESTSNYCGLMIKRHFGVEE
jgi:hypothetical protein